MQHSQEPRKVLDNFGDEDTQAALPDAPLDKAKNVLGHAVTAAGGGLDIWTDLQLGSLASAAHETKGTQVSWTQPDVAYSSVAGGLGVAPTDVFALRIAQFYQDDTLTPCGPARVSPPRTGSRPRAR